MTSILAFIDVSVRLFWCFGGMACWICRKAVEIETKSW